MRGFTLIELLIVVAIMALLTGLILPLAVGRVRGAESAAATAPIEQASPSLEAVGAVRQPITESSQFQVALQARQEIDGWKIGTRYHARVEAIYVIRNSDARELKLAFPFPAGITEARSVTLARLVGGAWVEPTGVSYDLQAVRWTGAVDPDERVTLRIAYESEGRDAFVFDVAGSGRTGTVQAEVVLDGVERPVIPASSLPPTAIAPGRLWWSFEHLLTSERIRVELPPGPSPLGRLVLLCQLAALAVLLFGAGFWYLSELDQPGRLDSFRWGHFLLLAGNYSLFFAVFAFAPSGDARWGMALGGGVSLPLLYVHVSRFVSGRFARTRVMPLAVVTLFMVVAAVYLPSWRPALALASGALGAAFVTLTYRDFAARRIAWSDEKKRLGELREQRAHIDSLLAASEEPLLALDAALEAAPESPERLHARAVREPLVELRSDGERVKRELKESGPSARAIGRLKRQLEEAAEAAQRAVLPLRQRQRAPDRPLHCAACGAPGPRGTRHCAACGAAHPEERACQGCGERTRLPLHLLRPTALASPLHCAGCGARLD